MDRPRLRFVPCGRNEELVLERIEATEHDRQVVLHTQAGRYPEAIKHKRLGDIARERIAELEREVS